MCATYAPRDPIGEYWRGQLSLRGLRVLVEGLPPDSRLHRATPESRGWTVTDHLLADLWDAMNALVMLTSGNFEHPPELPERRPRPGDEARALIEAKAAARKAKTDAVWLSSVEKQLGVVSRR